MQATGQHTTVTVSVHREGRQNPWTLDVSCQDGQSVSHVVGIMQKIVHQHWRTPRQVREMMQQLAKRLGEEGYEIRLM